MAIMPSTNRRLQKMSHYVEKCIHGVIVGQCRCPSKDKTVRVVSCPEHCRYTGTTDPAGEEDVAIETNISNSDKLNALIFMAIGEVTALFMTNPKPGIEQVMPESDCSRIGHELASHISKIYREMDIAIEVNTSANLGYATTGELIEELAARFEIQCVDSGGLNYRTVDGDDNG